MKAKIYTQYERRLEYLCFDSLYKLKQHIDNPPELNPLWDDDDLSSQEELYSPSEFHDTKNFNEFKKFLFNGTKTYYRYMKHNLDKIESKYKFNYSQKKYKNSVVGFAPIVPESIKNNPVCMVTTEPKINDTKLTIYMDITVPATTGVSTIINFRASVLYLLNFLDTIGVKTEIRIITVSEDDDEFYVTEILLKRYNERLNLFKLAFPLISPDMLRRCKFYLLEHSTVHTSSWCYGYGTPAFAQIEKRGALFNKIWNLKSDRNIFIPPCYHFDYTVPFLPQIISKTKLKNYLKIKDGKITLKQK